MSVSIADDMIRAFFERWKRLEEAKAEISDDLKELFAEMKGSGFDTKVARKVFRDKTVDQNERAEFEAIYDLYWSALSGPRAGRAREGEQIDAETGEITEPQPSPMAGKAAASTPPEVAAEIAEPADAAVTAGNDLREPVAAEQGQIIREGDAPRETDRDYSGDASRPDAVQGGSEPTEAHNLGQAGSTPAPATSSHSSDLHDGRLQAVPAPALDESRDSAAGVEAPAAPVNPRCLKHQRGEECKFSHKRYSCAGCNQAAELQRAGAA